jgi:hypothetical protein
MLLSMIPTRQYSNDIDHDKIVVLEARVMAIKSVKLYDLIQAAEMCLVLNIVVPKKFHLSEL